MEIECYADWEGLKDRMLTIKDSFMAMHSVDTPINSMWNDLVTELERALDDFLPKRSCSPQEWPSIRLRSLCASCANRRMKI